MGVACEAIGENPLAKLVPKLKPDEAHSVIAALEKIDAARVRWAEVRRNEDSFSRYQLRKGFNPITFVMTRWQRWRSFQQAERRHLGAPGADKQSISAPLIIVSGGRVVIT